MVVSIMTGYSSGSCLCFRVPVWRFRVPVFCNAPLFSQCTGAFHNIFGAGGRFFRNAPAHYEKSGALRKTVTRNLQTGTRKHKQEPLLSLASFPSWVQGDNIQRRACPFDGSVLLVTLYSTDHLFLSSHVFV